MSYINVSEIRYQNISSLQHIHDQKYVIKTKSSFMTRKLNFPKKISDLIICHPFVRTKMVSNPCNISTTRLMMKFIWFYVVPRTIFLMPVVKFVYFQTLHVTKSFKILWVILHKKIKWERSYITQCKAYQSHLAIPPFWQKIFKIILMFFLRIISNPFQSPIVQVLPTKWSPLSIYNCRQVLCNSLLTYHWIFHRTFMCI